MPSFETLYIDPDEEVPSVIARVKASTAKILVCVVPHRAILLSSVITMRLLKRETDRFQKDVCIVTQDEQGFAVACRVGFVAKKSLDELPFFSRKPSYGEIKDENTDKNRVRVHILRDAKVIENKGNALSLRNISSVTQKLSDGSVRDESEPILPNESIFRKEVFEKGGKSEKKEKGGLSIGSASWSGNGGRDDEKHFFREKRGENFEKKKQFWKGDVPFVQEEVEKSPARRVEKIGFRAQWIVTVSFFIVLGMSICIGMYLQSPEADVTVHMKRQSVSGDAGYVGSVDGGEIAVKFFEYDDVANDIGETTGFGNLSGTRAQGAVTLYNAFSKESQPLVATTRLQTAEGRIFRIVKSVTIPGFSEKDGEILPGSVRVDVRADEPGEAGNISPTKFTIPGFSNREKMEKIYAESQEAMTGGSSEGSSDRVVSQKDIETVRKKTEQRIRNAVFEKAKSDISSGMTVNDLIEITFVSETAVPAAGIVAKEVRLETKFRVRYGVFSDDDVRMFAARTLSEKNTNKQNNFDKDSITLEYGKISADFEKKSVDIKMFATATFAPEVPVDILRKDMAGKNESELQSIIEKYSQISGFEVQLRKAYFQDTLPSDPDRIHIQTD